MSDVVEKASEIAAAAQDLAEGKTKLEMSWMTVGIISMIGVMYIALASYSINMFSTCEHDQKQIYQTILFALVIGIAIPSTLIVSRLFNNEIAVFMLIYAIAGIATAIATRNLAVSCSRQTTVSDAGIGISILALLIGGFLMRPKGT
jgi:hypothetical protein